MLAVIAGAITALVAVPAGGADVAAADAFAAAGRYSQAVESLSGAVGPDAYRVKALVAADSADCALADALPDGSAAGSAEPLVDLAKGMCSARSGRRQEAIDRFSRVLAAPAIPMGKYRAGYSDVLAPLSSHYFALRELSSAYRLDRQFDEGMRAFASWFSAFRAETKAAGVAEDAAVAGIVPVDVSDYVANGGKMPETVAPIELFTARGGNKKMEPLLVFLDRFTEQQRLGLRRHFEKLGAGDLYGCLEYWRLSMLRNNVSGSGAKRVDYALDTAQAKLGSQIASWGPAVKLFCRFAPASDPSLDKDRPSADLAATGSSVSFTGAASTLVPGRTPSASRWPLVVGAAFVLLGAALLVFGISPRDSRR